MRRVLIISYRRFGKPIGPILRVQRNQKKPVTPKNGDYIGKCVGGENVSVVWRQPIGL